MEIGKGEVRIKIEVEGDEIRLRRNHAVTLYHDETITWTCDHLFAVQLPTGSPFKVINEGKKSTLVRTGKAVPHASYKYTISVFDGRKVLILDPLYVDAPPEG